MCRHVVRVGLQHRYVEEHKCDFDYKTLERGQLAAANQKVIGSKLDRL